MFAAPARSSGPLTLLLGPLGDFLAARGVSLAPEDRQALEVARRNALRLQKLVNSLLDFSRIEAGRMQAVYEPTDLATLTADLSGVFRSAIERAGMRLMVDCPRLTSEVYVDREMWEKIVLNLLSNAFKYTFAGEIRVTLYQVGRVVELAVHDTGIGIPEAELPRLFERFYRVEGAQGRTMEGTGIGLALVQELVRLHGGSIHVGSIPGRGSVFTVSVPLGKEHLPAERVGGLRTLASTATSARTFLDEALRWLPDEAAAKGIEEPLPISREIDAAPAKTLMMEGREDRPRILLVDDNADMRDYVRGFLREQYDVTAVEDGVAALAAASQSPPDLVLTDVVMPRLDGFGLLRAIRSDPAIGTIPVILLSARAGEESKVEGLARGADDYLVKPFSARELTARVAAHVALARLRNEVAARQAQEEHAAELQKMNEALLAEIAERKRVEASLQVQVGVVQRIPVAAWTVEPDGTPDFANQQWLEYTRQTLEFVRSGPQAWMTALHPDDRGRAERIFWDGIRSGRGFTMGARFRRASDGGYRWHLNRAVPLRDEEGNVVKFVGTATDIEDLKRAEEALRATQAELVRAVRVMTMGELAASIAHEVGQPIAAMMANAGTCSAWLSTEPPNLDRARAAAERMIHAAAEAGETIQRIRKFFQKAAPEKGRLRVNDIIEEIVPLAQSEAIRKGVSLRTELSPELPPVLGDRIQVQQVLLNLIVNAMEAVGDVNDRPRQLLIRSEMEDPNRVLVAVVDSGVGITAEAMKRLFEPFFTTKATRGGHGIVHQSFDH